MSRNSNQLSVAELLARNGQQPVAGGGRRRRGGRGVPASDQSGELPVTEGDSAHAAPEGPDYPEEAPAEYAVGPAASGYAPEGSDSGYALHDYAGVPVPGSSDPNHSPMSGPITAYDPLAPQQPNPGGNMAPVRLGDPSAAGSDPQAPVEEPTLRPGRRRRAEPDDDLPADNYPSADTLGQPSEADQLLPNGGRAARRRAAEAAEAAVGAEPVVPHAEPEAPAGYGLPPSGFDPYPIPPPRPQEIGRPGAEQPWPEPGPHSGSPRLGPPAPATEVWKVPAPTEDPRPALERRRRGTRPVPDPAPRPEPGEAAANADHATTVWSVAEQNQPPRSGPPDLAAPPLEKADRGRRGKRNGGPGAVAAAGSAGPGFADLGPPPPDFRGDAAVDMYATDVYKPMAPPPAPGPSEDRPGTGEFDSVFDPDSETYAELGAEAAEPGKGRGRAALTAKLGAATGKFAATRALASGAARKRDDDEAAADPRKQWMVLGAQTAGAAVAGMLMFKGSEMLWEIQPLAALVLAVVVILGLVALVRILRRTDDILSTVIAVVVGVFVTLGPLAFLLSTG